MFFDPSPCHGMVAPQIDNVNVRVRKCPPVDRPFEVRTDAEGWGEKP